MKKFDIVTALVFSDLYSNFPMPELLDPTVYLDKVVAEDEYDEAFNFNAFFWHTIDWLIAEDYVRITTDASCLNSKAYYVVLTGKGLEALRQVPDSLQDKKPLGERLADFSKDKGSEAVSTLISLVINTASKTVGS